MRGLKAAVAIICTAALVAASGCVDIYGARELFGGKKPSPRPSYRERCKVLIAHAFNYKFADPTSWVYVASQQAFVKRDTEWLKVYIDVTIVDFNLLPIDISDITGYFQRYLRVEVITSDGTSWLDQTYYATAHENITAMGPIDGPWTVRVEAGGLGNATLGLQDNFKVMLTVREPG
ncbi:MAG: hypothetical protein QXH42_09140 [Thermoplasmata archaeon]